MSNRKRREWLLAEKRRQLDEADIGDELDSFSAEFKYRVRSHFSFVERQPLRFSNNRQGSDNLGGSLIDVQGKNMPPPFNPLFDDLHHLLIEADWCRLWSSYQSDLEEADRTFNAALGMLSKHGRVVSSSSDEPVWTDGMQRAARSINGVRRSVFQYADRFPSVLQSARLFWPECKDIGDSDVLALLAADQAHAAAKILVNLIKDVEERAMDEDISRRDDGRFSMLLTEISEKRRQDSSYGFGKLRRARDLLRLAQLAELAAESELARLRFEEQEREFMRRESDMARKIERVKNFDQSGGHERGLWRLVDEILDTIGAGASARQVWDQLKAYKGKGVVYDINEHEVSWITAAGHLAKAPTGFRSFETTLSNKRKKKRGG